MSFMEIIGYILAALVGISLGLIGSGGSILTVPILVYVMGVNPVTATAYSLFIVGSTALVGGVRNALQKQVVFKTALMFGIPSIISVFATRRWIVPNIPDEIFSLGSFTLTKPIALLILFAIVMIFASIRMIRSGRKDNQKPEHEKEVHLFMLWMQGVMVGLLAGLVGAGGGFLIIPALVLMAGMPMKKAVGTSLFIIAAQSLIGFTGDLQGGHVIDWGLLFRFTGFAIAGILLGIALSKKFHADKLKIVFGWFVLLMGIYILVRELFFSA